MEETTDLESGRTLLDLNYKFRPHLSNKNIYLFRQVSSPSSPPLALRSFARIVHATFCYRNTFYVKIDQFDCNCSVTLSIASSKYFGMNTLHSRMTNTNIS